MVVGVSDILLNLGASSLGCTRRESDSAKGRVSAF